MKTIVITGADEDIGAAAAHRLACRGHRVILIGGDLGKTRSAALPINAPYHLAEFAELDDVERLAAELLSEYLRIDVLATNLSTVVGNRRTETVDGHELIFQINYLAPWYLSWLLTDQLLYSRATMIIASSLAHRVNAHFEMGDLNAERHYSLSSAFGNATLARMLQMRELQARYGAQGLSAVAFDGGAGRSSASGLDPIAKTRFHAKRSPRTASVDKAVDTLVWLAEGTPGINYRPDRYYVNRSARRTGKTADDRGLAAELWRHTELVLDERIRRFQPDAIRTRV